MGLKNLIQCFFTPISQLPGWTKKKGTHATHVTIKLHNTERKLKQLMTSVIYDIHKAHSSHIRSALKSNKEICIHSVPFNVRGFHAGRAHVCITKQKFKKRKEKGHPESGRAKMESHWIVELTSSGRVDAVKKGPFPLIIYFPIRHCPARGKNTFI